jgi:formate dehydrogenase iron-sulfur subunit
MAQQTDIFPPPGEAMEPPGAFEAQPMGFYTDTTVCIGCKACEVACKNWNGLSARDGGAQPMSGDSYDNTRTLDGEHWRHVKFIEQFSEDRSQGRWLMMSDVCKHCVQAGCLEVCPTNAIIRTEFDTVVIQADVCNGCRDCIAACPFGVIEVNPVNNTAMKCTLCYDRMQNGLVPACAQACPTASIQFGPIAELRELGAARVEQLNTQSRDAGRPEDAYLYGADDSIVGGLNSFYLLIDEPEVYGLPRAPKLPSSQLPATTALTAAGAAGLGLLGLLGFRKRRMDDFAAEARADAAGAGTAPESVRLAPGETVVVEPERGPKGGVGGEY